MYKKIYEEIESNVELTKNYFNLEDKYIQEKKFSKALRKILKERFDINIRNRKDLKKYKKSLKKKKTSSGGKGSCTRIERAK